MKRIHLLVILFVFGFVGLALASATQATETPKDKPAACEKKATAEGCCKKDGDAATCKKDAAACPMKKNADGVAVAGPGCCEPGMACCSEGKCCKHHEDAKPTADASGVMKVSDEATAGSCCATGSACCETGSKCCAKAA